MFPRSDSLEKSGSLAKARADTMLQEKTFATGAVTLNYLDHGPSAAAPLVILHGGACVKSVLIDGVGQVLHLEDHGQTPVLTEMLRFLEYI